MKSTIAGVLTALFLMAAFAACGGQPAWQDGEYSATFRDFDSRGYRDFVKVTVKDGKVSAAVFDAEDKDGNLRSRDEKYRTEMEKVQETYPEKYAADLVNQYLEAQDIEGVDALAGATVSTDNFVALVTALEKSMEDGDVTPVVIDNLPEK